MTSQASTYDSDLENLITDWEALKRERPHIRTSAASKNRIGTVIQFIGLPYDNEKELNLRREGRPGSRWMYFTLQVDPDSVGLLKGAAQFGSQANGTYHIFCSGRMPVLIWFFVIQQFVILRRTTKAL